MAAKKEPDKPEDVKKETGDEDAIAKVCEGLGIDEKHVASSRVLDDGTVSIVTVGGTKIRFTPAKDKDDVPVAKISGFGRNIAWRPKDKDDKGPSLKQVEIDGVSPKTPRKITQGKG